MHITRVKSDLLRNRRCEFGKTKALCSCDVDHTVERYDGGVIVACREWKPGLRHCRICRVVGPVALRPCWSNCCACSVDIDCADIVLEVSEPIRLDKGLAVSTLVQAWSGMRTIAYPAVAVYESLKVVNWKVPGPPIAVANAVKFTGKVRLVVVGGYISEEVIVEPVSLFTSYTTVAAYVVKTSGYQA
jgi:hypothetical protein